MWAWLHNAMVYYSPVCVCVVCVSVPIVFINISLYTRSFKLPESIINEGKLAYEKPSLPHRTSLAGVLHSAQVCQFSSLLYMYYIFIYLSIYLSTYMAFNSNLNWW